MKNWPVLLIAALLGLVGIVTLIAPDPLLGAYPHHSLFQVLGQMPIGIYMLITSALMVRESLVTGIKRYIGVFMGIMGSIFWAVATIIPLFVESMPPLDDITVLGITFKGPIDTVAALAWTAIVALLVYYYFKAKELTRSQRRARL